MEWLEILKRVELGEDEHTEFKRDVELKRIGQAVCAMANSNGGVIILGVDDEQNIRGVSEPPEKVSERLTSFLQSGLNAPIQARLGRHKDPGGWVHWLVIPRQRGYEPFKYDGRVYIRRGRSSPEPGPQELQDLYNRFGYIVTEEQVVMGTGVGDLDLDSFNVFMKRFGIELDSEPRLVLEDDLVNRGLLSELDGRLFCTIYGLLAFGKMPQRHHQTGQFWVECVAYAGVDRADDVVGRGEAKGKTSDLVEQAMMWFRALGRSERYSGLVRSDIGIVPEEAIREALVNAVCHRDYAITGSRILMEVFTDRLVVSSPGALPNHMTPEKVMAGGRPRSRNELIANHMQIMGYMEGRGRGWPRIKRAMRDFNGLEPELEVDGDSRWVRVFLPLSQSYLRS